MPAHAPPLPPWSWRRRLLALAAGLCGLACGAPAIGTEPPPAPPAPRALGSPAAKATAGDKLPAAQVLVLTGSDPYLAAFVAIDSATRAAMAQRLQRPVVWLYESIDTVRLRGLPGTALADVLARKYERVQIDAVVLATEPAVDFHLRFGPQLWPQAVAVYHFVTPAYARQLPPGAGLSGIPSAIDYAGTLRIALALQPQARRVVLVGGVSSFDEQQLMDAGAALQPYRDRLAIEVLAGPSPQALADRLAGESLDTIVLYNTLFRDAEGRVYQPRDALATISAGSGAPVYGPFEGQMGVGLVAGAQESNQVRGERIADLLARALSGPLPARAVIEPAPASTCTADARQLQRFGLRAQALPPGCVLRFAEAPFLQRYGWQSALVALVVLAQSALMAALLVQRRRRLAAESSAQSQRAQFLHASRLAVAGELTASIAHEINQPLAAILANADAAEMMIESGRLQTPELQQILADIKRDDLRASAVIQRLRALLSHGEVERQRFDLHATVQDTAALLQAEAHRRGVVVDYNLQARQSAVMGDAIQIQQVLINLLLNAFEGCAALPAAARRVQVETSDSARGVQLCVRDGGAGIATADLPRVFDPFFSTKPGGMGLGLAIAHTIIEAHGGTIQAIARPVGAELCLVLPASVDTTFPPPVTSPVTSPAAPAHP